MGILKIDSRQEKSLSMQYFRIKPPLLNLYIRVQEDQDFSDCELRSVVQRRTVTDICPRGDHHTNLIVEGGKILFTIIDENNVLQVRDSGFDIGEKAGKEMPRVIANDYY